MTSLQWAGGGNPNHKTENKQRGQREKKKYRVKLKGVSKHIWLCLWTSRKTNMESKMAS